MFKKRIFKLLITVLLLLGVCFRFVSLGDRPYWHDEAHTLIRSSGYTIAEITSQIFNGQLLDRAQILQYQRISRDRTEVDVLHSLATEEPHRAPLFYILAHAWIRWFGDDLAIIRTLSVLCSLLVFPAMYWICSELFASSVIRWIALALVSVSPFQVYYAQEIREYSLWAVTTLVSSATYLRATRLREKSAWGLYSIAIIFSFYTSLLSLLVWLGHCIHAMLFQKQIHNFLKASLIGFTAYAPWSFLVVMNLAQVQRNNAWMFQPIPIQALFNHWITNYQFIFVRSNLTGSFSWLFTVAIAVLTVLAARSLILRTPKTVWVFITLLILPLLVTFVVPDLVLGGLRSTNGRYFVPCYLGIQIAVAHFLTIQSSRLKQWVFATLLIAGILSCTVQSIQNRATEDFAIAALINQSKTAIVISAEESYQGGGTIGDILSLSHLVKPSTQFQLVIQPEVPILPNQSNLYLFKPLAYLKQHLEKTYILQPIYKDKLFRILLK